MTLNEAKALTPGQIIYHMSNRNADGTAQRWKVNGKVKTWKRNPKRVYIPLKYGLYAYDSADENYLHLLSLVDPTE